MASGDTLCIFGAINNEPPAANNALFAVVDSHPILNFSAQNSEADFVGVLPSNYTGGGITIYLHYTNSLTATQTTWTLSFNSLASGQAANPEGAYVANTGLTVTSGGTAANMNVGSFSISAANTDNIAAGNAFHFRLIRTDATALTLYVFAIELRET